MRRWLQAFALALGPSEKRRRRSFYWLLWSWPFRLATEWLHAQFARARGAQPLWLQEWSTIDRQGRKLPRSHHQTVWWMWMSDRQMLVDRQYGVEVTLCGHLAYQNCTHLDKLFSRNCCKNLACKYWGCCTSRYNSPVAGCTWRRQKSKDWRKAAEGCHRDMGRCRRWASLEGSTSNPKDTISGRHQSSESDRAGWETMS